MDAYIHPSPGLKNWDLCAPESLIKAMGGYATDLHEKRLTYHPDCDPQLKGLVLAKNPPMYNLIRKRMGDLLPSIVAKVKF